MNLVIFHLALKDQRWTYRRSLKKGLTKVDVICVKYTEPHNILPRSEAAAFFAIGDAVSRSITRFRDR